MGSDKRGLHLYDECGLSDVGCLVMYLDYASQLHIPKLRPLMLGPGIQLELMVESCELPRLLNGVDVDGLIFLRIRRCLWNQERIDPVPIYAVALQ